MMIAYQVYKQELHGDKWKPMDKQPIRVDGFNVLMMYVFKDRSDADWVKLYLDRREENEWPDNPEHRSNYKIVKVEILEAVK